METQTEQKELVWLPASLAKRIKDIQDTKYLENEIVKYTEETKRNFKTEIECIDEDVLQYKAFMIKAKNAFKDAKDEHLNASYELWEKYETDLTKVRQYVNTVNLAIEPLKKELNDVKNLMQEIDKYGIKDLLELIKEVNSHYYGETANMLKFLFDNYKKP